MRVEDAQTGRSQRTYARIAGFLMLGIIILAFVGGFILSRVAPSGTFAETAERIAASKHLYRAALSTVVMASLGSALLAFALYATLKPVNSLLAQLALIFTLGDSFLALVVRMCSFVNVHLYLSTQTLRAELITAQSLAELMRTVANNTENLGGICFGIGSFLFFYLFFQSRYIPRIHRSPGPLCFGDMDNPVFCQSDNSGTAQVVYGNLLSSDGRG